MSKRRSLVSVVLPVLLVGVACGYKDKGGRIVERSFKVTFVADNPMRLVLQPDDCPTEQVQVDAAVTGAQTRHKANLACLGALHVGDTVRHERQGEAQGCVPGKVQYELLGNCELGPLTLTSTGTRCAAK
jgi:hypothetical protein